MINFRFVPIVLVILLAFAVPLFALSGHSTQYPVILQPTKVSISLNSNVNHIARASIPVSSMLVTTVTARSNNNLVGLDLSCSNLPQNMECRFSTDPYGTANSTCSRDTSTTGACTRYLTIRTTGLVNPGFYTIKVEVRPSLSGLSSGPVAYAYQLYRVIVSPDTNAFDVSAIQYGGGYSTEVNRGSFTAFNFAKTTQNFNQDILGCIGLPGDAFCSFAQHPCGIQFGLYNLVPTPLNQCKLVINVPSNTAPQDYSPVIIYSASSDGRITGTKSFYLKVN